MLRVYTSQVGRYRGPDGLDTTIKSSSGIGRVFAPPSWGMVMGLKRGRVSWEAYTGWYLGHLRRMREERRDAFEALLARDRVVLLCYCRPGERCHRRLLAQVLAQEGAQDAGEIAAPQAAMGGSWREAA